MIGVGILTRVNAMHYFAYGANMRTGHMADVTASAELLGPAELPGHRFVINRNGVATVVPALHARVMGTLWRIGGQDEAGLDEYEGVAWGVYRKTRQVVRCAADGRLVSALMYVADESAPGTPRRDYLQGIVEAATDHGFDAAYVGELRTWFSYGQRKRTQVFPFERYPVG